MKKYFYNIPAVIAIALTTVACSQKEALVSEKENPEEQLPKISVAVEGATENSSLGTKTYLEKDTTSHINVIWEESDKIAVYDNLSSDANEFEILEGSIEKGKATFTGEVSEGYSSMIAVYPTNAAAGKDGSNVKVTVPSAQQIGAQNVATGSLVTVASAAKGEGFSFKNVCGLLAVQVTYNDIASIVVEGTNLCGTVSVNPSTGEISEVTSGANAITVTPRDTTAFKKGVYYIAVLPGTTQAGTPFKVSMVRGGGYSTAVKTTEKGVTIARNAGFNFANLDASLEWECHIANKEQLLAWNSTVSQANDEVYLDADIDLSGETWTPKYQKGTFYGQNHKIYNVTVSPLVLTDRIIGGFFAKVYGTVQDLVLGSSDGESYDGTSIVKLGATDLAGWSFAGGVAGTLDGGQIKNVKTFTSVEVSSEFAKKVKQGGIVGIISTAESKLTDCCNYGAVTNNATTSSTTTDGNRSNLGGLVGNCEDKAGIEISGCSNYGTVTSNNPEVEFVGGIIGVTNGVVAANFGTTTTYTGNNISINNCTNYGNVVLSAGAKPSVGGVAGCICAATLDGCVNEGTVTANVASELKIGGIAGKLVADKAVTIKGCVNGNSADHNKGSIMTSTGTASAFVGGILGNSPAATTGALSVTGCKNYADLSTSNAYAGYIGGFGGYWNTTKCVVTMENCENFGAVSNTSTVDAGDNVVAGFVASFQNAKANISSVTGCVNHAKVTDKKAKMGAAFVGGLFGTACYLNITSCTNEGDVYFSNSLAATNAMNIGGFVGFASNAINFKDCINSGSVQIASSKVKGNGYAGGFVGNMTNSTADNCDNSGDISVLNGYSGDAYAGGVAATTQGSTIMNGSDNTGAISAQAQKLSRVGGIVGYMGLNTTTPVTTTINGSTNKGKVSVSKKTGHFLVGGIIGDSGAYAYKITGCVNEGAVSANQTGYTKQYFAVGGIAGRTRGASGTIYELSGCTNRGTVTVTANSDNQLCNAGGIVGETNTYSTITNNVNEATGTVSCTNKVASTYTVRTAYAGGISGGDNEGTVGAAGYDTVTGNTNYANVSATVTNGATAIGAGGVFGMLQRTGTFTGNKVYGNVTTTVTGTESVGGAGAVLGYYASTAVTGITAEIQKTVVVAGTTYSAAEAAGTLATWLCPTSGAPITPTYKD